jgi:hypothetical protein
MRDLQIRRSRDRHQEEIFSTPGREQQQAQPGPQ